MKIIKRNGESTNFSPNKILTRIKKTAKGLKVDSDMLAIKVQGYLVDGITTQEIDDTISKISAQFSIDHPDYSLLSARIISSKIHKDYGASVEDWKRRLKPYLKQEVFDKQEKWGVEPNYEYDDSFDFLGISSFITVYGVKSEKYNPVTEEKEEMLVELPAELMFRVALYLSESKEEFETRYNSLTDRNYGGATPVLMNAGTHNSTMISCSVNELMGDSLEGINNSIQSVTKMSKDGSGIGFWASNLRSDRTRYANKGNAGGIQRFAKILDANLRFFKQNSSRRGKGALYLNIWHRDLYKFIELASKEGSDETTARDLMTAVIINDLFYKRITKEDTFSYENYHGEIIDASSKWSLFCPHDIKKHMGYNLYDFHGEEFEKRYKECEANKMLPRDTHDCEDIMKWIVNMQSQAGYPYVLNIDNVNKANNQSNYGVIKMSQLCVSHDTNLLTDKGNIIIGDNVGKKVKVWNGKSYKEVEVLKTGENEELLTVVLSNGTQIEATNLHRWYITENGKEIIKSTNELVEGDIITDYELPKVNGTKVLINKDKAPVGDYQLTEKINWLSNKINEVGYVRNDNLTIGGVDVDETNDIISIINELGIKISDKIGKYNILINQYGIDRLLQSGIHAPNAKLTFKGVSKDDELRILSVIKTGKMGATYCVSEPEEMSAVFNGILTGNCIEIVQYTDSTLSAQCCLGALLLKSYVNKGKFDYDALRLKASELNYMLNRVINKNDWSNKYSEKGGLTQRATAMGVAGLADVFYMMDIPFESEEAKEMSTRIAETMYYGAIEGSVKFRKENGETILDSTKELLDNTELGKGKFIFENYENVKTTLDWGSLRKEVLEHGVANSMLIGYMPTASSSTLAMQNEMYEPMQDIAVVRKTVSGEFPFINKYLIDDLDKKGILIEDLVQEIKYYNSVQNVNFGAYTDDTEWVNKIKLKYKTIWEMPQRVMIELASERQRFTDQSQSMNLYWAEPSVKKLTSALVYGWKNGLKTGVYYTKTKPKTSGDKSLGFGTKNIGKVDRVVSTNPSPNEDFFCDGCSS